MKTILGTMLAVMSLAAGNVFAGANFIELTDDSGPVGGQVTFEIHFTDAPALTNTLQFSMSFNSTVFSLDSCVLNNPGDWVFPTCQVTSPGVLAFATLDPPPGSVVGGGMDPTLMATVTFNINAGPPGIYMVNVVPPIVTSDGDTTNTDPAVLEVLGASYDPVTPATDGAGGAVEFNFGSLTMGVDPNGELPLEIGNDGQPSTTLNGSCSISGPGAAAFSQTPDNTFAVDEGGANDMSTIVCNSGSAVGNYTATLSCMHDGDSSPASPVQYDLACNILAAPAPTLGSTPQSPGMTIDFGGPYFTDDSDPMAMLNISNVGNLDPLDVDPCTITNSAGGVFSLAGDPVSFSLDQKDPPQVLTLTCDVSVGPGMHMGELSCTHNGSNGPTSTWPLSCQVDPRPTYNDTPDSLSMSGNQGNGDPTDTLFIDNNGGETGSTLTGSCSLDMGGDPEISLPSGGAFSVAQGANQGIVVACDGTATPDFYSATLRCIPDAPVSNPGEYTTPVNCTIDAPDPAIYSSTPYAEGNPGDPIDVNEGNDPPPVDGTPPSTVLTIFNGADPGDDYLDLMGCAYSGDPEITDSPTPVNDDLQPGQSVDVTFTCSTATDGTFSGTYTCPFDDNPTPPPLDGVNGGGATSPATYAVNCVVREQFSDVEESPPSGTPQTADLMPGETADWDFEFEEMIGEGLDGSLDTCSLSGDPAFSITTSTSYPQPIPSGGPPVLVNVDFTDPGVGDNFHTDLNCTFTDNPDGGEPEQTMVSWPIDVTVTGRNVTFLVTKDFSDDNPAGVEVLLECNTGLPLQQSGTVHDPDAAGLGPGDFTHLNFVVVDFDPGTMDCDIEETVPEGYEAQYSADYGQNGSAGDVDDDAFGCHYEGLESADFTCDIYNDLQPVDVVVEKQWIDDNPGYQLPTFVHITLTCDADIDGGYDCGGNNQCIEQYIDPSHPGEFSVLPYFGGTSCSASEESQAGVLTDDSDCASMSLLPGQGDSCVIVNTRLYAGIPTLSQYGLMLLALLMLGVGLIGFRRYT